MGPLRWIPCTVIAVLALAVVLAARPLAYSQGWLVSGGSPTLAPSVFAPYRVPGKTENSTKEKTASSPSSQKLTAALMRVPKTTDAKLSAYIVDLGSGEVLFEREGTKPVVPASSIKLLTGMAVLSQIDAGKVFDTRTVLVDDNQLVLVGAGDPNLRAEPVADGSYPAAGSTRELARLTAIELKKRGLHSIAVGFDDGLFDGPEWHVDWQPGDEFYVAPITALSVNGGQVGEGKPMSRKPSHDAATIFVRQLGEEGIQVSGEPNKVRVDAGAVQVAKISSAPVHVLVREALLNSDNTATEVLLRHLALAKGFPGSFDGGVQALRAILEKRELWVQGQRIVDGSGLSGNNRVSTQVLAKAVLQAASDPVLSRLLDGLPVGGATGTLRHRFTAREAQAGRGWVHAKTGTLTSVGALTGYAQTADGALVGFSLIANDGRRGEIRPYLDRLVATIAACGC